MAVARGDAGCGGLAIYSLFQAVRSMRRKTPLDFQLQNLVSWLATSFIGGLLVRYGPTDPALTDAKLLENPEP